MSDLFRIHLAIPADAETIAWHRARMFQDMGEVPVELFETFRAKSRDRLHDALAHGEYVGWLASLENDSNIVVAGAGVHLHRTLPHPLSRSALAESRLGVIVNVFTEPEWRRRRRGVAGMLLRRIIEWARAERLDRLVLHASEEGQALYERLGFITSNEMRLASD